MFPSPCGVLVLKSLSRNCIPKLCLGFRPLAGFWFLNREKRVGCDPSCTVSVPLRGSGS